MEGVDVSGPGFDVIRLDADNNVWGMISSLRFMGDATDSISHLVKLDQAGDITGHWKISNPGSMPAFWNFEISASGDFFFAGIDDNNQAAWETATHTPDPFTGQVDDEQFEIADALNSIENSIISSSDITGILDTGGGGSDMLVIKLDPNSLP